MQPDGNLVTYITAFPLESVIDDYWSTNTVGSGFQIIFNQSGSIYLEAENRSILRNIAGGLALWWKDDIKLRIFEKSENFFDGCCSDSSSMEWQFSPMGVIRGSEYNFGLC
ncbi:hypothetical protein SLA2020_323540 [Shorea laevis]